MIRWYLIWCCNKNENRKGIEDFRNVCENSLIKYWAPAWCLRELIETLSSKTYWKVLRLLETCPQRVWGDLDFRLFLSFISGLWDENYSYHYVPFPYQMLKGNCSVWSWTGSSKPVGWNIKSSQVENASHSIYLSSIISTLWSTLTIVQSCRDEYQYLKQQQLLNIFCGSL